MNIFAERLTLVLQNNEMKQSVLAKKINMSADTVSAYCRGVRIPPIDVLVLICKALDETADYMLGLSDK